MRAVISLAPNGVIVIQSRYDGPGGTIGDLFLEVEPGQTVVGIPHHVWRNHVGKDADLDEVRRDADAAARG